jgi:HNH endonuclease
LYSLPEDLDSERFEIIDGQQWINALADFFDDGFKLLHPIKDDEKARFPDFIKAQPCPWAELFFEQLSDTLQQQFTNTMLRVVKIETDKADEARDLFIRLQAGMPLNSQEKRDAWPGQFTDFVLRLGGKQGVGKYQGHEFFNDLTRARPTQDRGKFRQLFAQMAMLFFTHRGDGSFCDINSEAIDDYYYQHLGFDSNSAEAKRLSTILEKITMLLQDQKRPKLIGHEAIHLVLLVDALLDEYTRSWEAHFASAFDEFRGKLAKAKATGNDRAPAEYWLRYGVGTRVSSDRKDVIQRRHEFFAEEMCRALKPQVKDPQRAFGLLERELIYYRDNKKCAECDADVIWAEAEFHHVEQHGQGGRTHLENGALVHHHCHPKGTSAESAFAEKWRKRMSPAPAPPPSPEELSLAAEEEENADA